MKKIYRAIVLLGLTVTLGTSCSDWLNVYPSDQIKEEYLFATGDGYRAALNGIYRKMATFNVYGSNLKWGIIDAWGQVYDMNLGTGSAGGQAMKKIELLEFKHYEVVPTTDKMWNDSWNIVANCNELAQQAEQADNELFYSGEKERVMILGEAIALRAYIQFDLLRIYAPSPAMKPENRTFIPYINEYPAYISNRQTVSYCLEQIVKDLKRAQEILLTVDEDVSWNTRFGTPGISENIFLEARGYRLNYYAVTAALARVYLYAGKLEDAYAQASIVIEKGSEFEALTGNKALTALKEGNIKMFDDVVFALFSSRDQVDWDQLINHSGDKNDGAEGKEYFLGITSTIAETRYGDDINTDWRLSYQMEKRLSDDYRSLKYYKQPESFKRAMDNNKLVPMIRMSEVYYIAAEAIYKQDLNKAIGYLEKVKNARGVVQKLEGVDLNNFMDILVNDAQREFFGEGQSFFMFKRLLRPMKGRVEIAPLEKNMVLPLPDSESSI